MSASVPQTNWAMIRRLLALGWRYRVGSLKVVGYQVVLLIIGMSGLALTGVGIDYVRQQVQHTSRPPRWPFGISPPDDWSPMLVLGAIAAAIFTFALVRSGLNFLYTVALSKFIQMEIVVQLRADVYDKLQRLSFRFFDANASGTIINRVTGDVQSVRLFVDGVLIQSVIMALSLGVYLAYMLTIHPTLTVTCLATTPLLWLASTLFSRIVRPLYDKSRELSDRMVLTLSESIQGIQVVRGFAREREEIARFQAATRAVRDHQFSIFRRVSVFSPTIGLLTQTNIVILLAYGGFLVIEDELPLGAGLVVFAGLLQQFSGQIQNIATIANSIQESLTGARRVFEVLDAPLEIQAAPDAVRILKARGGVEFEHVSFEYVPGDPVLQDVHFQVQPGQCVAILGATGSGKSTLLSLVPRFYDPTKGRVLIDGVDARRINLDDLRRNIGIVFQESFLFSNSVAANIAFGHPNATREQVERAAKIAAAHEFILRLPQGYDTVLGEGGADLSGGQRQRLAIARAVLLEPSILLLDDPTAAIDPQTEHEILEAMDNAMEGRTTFVVAHRLSTLRRADMVIVLENGRIVQMGTHAELIKMKGHYQRAATLQVVDEESRRLLGGTA